MAGEVSFFSQKQTTVLDWQDAAFFFKTDEVIPAIHLSN
jgi:hypothetical protein